MHGKWQESVGNCNRLQTPATPRFVDRHGGALSATLGLATLGLGTHQDIGTKPAHQERFEPCDPSIPPEEFLGPSGPRTPLGGWKGRNLSHIFPHYGRWRSRVSSGWAEDKRALSLKSSRTALWRCVCASFRDATLPSESPRYQRAPHDPSYLHSKIPFFSRRPANLKNLLIWTRWIGANPEKSDLVNFGVRTKENLVNSVFCYFSWKNRQNIPKIPV